MIPKISGIKGSRSSEGTNKYFSFKRIIASLKMISLMIRNSPNRISAGHSHGLSTVIRIKEE